jgi:hypothetical protein
MKGSPMSDDHNALKAVLSAVAGIEPDRVSASVQRPINVEVQINTSETDARTSTATSVQDVTIHQSGGS